MMIKTASFIKQHKATIGTLMLMVVLPLISIVADNRLELDATKLGYLGFIAFSILAMALPLESNYWKAKEDRMNEYLTQRFRKLGVTLQEHKRKRQELCQIKDTANPKRVENRQKRAAVWQTIKVYSFFIILCIIAPLAGIIVGVWQKSVGNETWAIIVGISILAFVQIWGVILTAVLKMRNEKQE